jgi:hypothetical protein
MQLFVADLLDFALPDILTFDFVNRFQITRISTHWSEFWPLAA